MRGLIVKRHVYRPQPKGWVLTDEEYARAIEEGVIPDQRQPRRVVQCRRCGKMIEKTEARVVFKLHDPETKWTLAEGFIHKCCVGGNHEVVGHSDLE